MHKFVLFWYDPYCSIVGRLKRFQNEFCRGADVQRGGARRCRDGEKEVMNGSTVDLLRTPDAASGLRVRACD